VGALARPLLPQAHHAPRDAWDPAARSQALRGHHGDEVRTPDVVVSRMLGHSRTQTTKDLYSDFMPKDATGATDAIGNVIAWDR